MKILFFILIISCWWTTGCHAFGITTSVLTIRRHELSSSTQIYFFQNVLESLNPSKKQPNSNSKSDLAQKRQELKTALLQECQISGPDQRTKIEALMGALQQVNPTPASAASPLLRRKWALEWTTEKEINFFLDNGWSNEIGQTISDTTINNNIEFVKGGGGFYVTGKLTVPDPEGPRTEFEFETATLKLTQNWGQLSFPPVGQGWFDTIYLDDSLRVDINSRNDILICTPYSSNNK